MSLQDDNFEINEMETQFDDCKTISFKGEYSPESKAFLRKQHKKMGLKLALFVIIPTVIVGIVMFACKLDWYWPALCLVLGIFVGVFFGLVMAYSNNFADQIDIENNIIYITNEKGGLNISQDIENVECVMDLGSFYYIKFFGGRFPFGVCQKDLLVSGTIEDFEQEFGQLLQRSV